MALGELAVFSHAVSLSTKGSTGREDTQVLLVSKDTAALQGGWGSGVCVPGPRELVGPLL